MKRTAAHAGAGAFEKPDILSVVCIVIETTQMHMITPGEMAQHLPRPDLIALVGRIGNALGEKQKMIHAAPGRRSGRALTGRSPERMPRPCGPRRKRRAGAAASPPSPPDWCSACLLYTSDAADDL